MKVALAAAVVVAGFLAVAIGTRLSGDRVVSFAFGVRGFEATSEVRLAWRATLLMFLVVPVTWLVWQHRVHSNVRALAPGGDVAGPGWGVLCWFVPFVNLVEPFRMLDGIRRSSSPNSSPNRNDRIGPLLLACWWILWLICSALVVVGVGSVVADIATVLNRMPDVHRATVELSERTLWLFLGVEIAVSVDAVLAFAVVRLITERQVEGARGSIDGLSAPARPDLG